MVLAGWALFETGARLEIGIPAALLMTIPLAWRRGAPTIVAFVVAGGFALQATQPNPPESLATLIAILVAAYSVAAYGEGWRLGAGLAAITAGALAETALAGDGDYTFILVVLAGAVVAGRALGSRSRQADAESRRIAAEAVRAEREHIARELHDSVAHSVSLMVVQAGAAEASGAGPGALRQIRDTGRDAVADLGRMVSLLREDSHGEALPTLADTGRLVEPFRHAGLAIGVHVEGPTRALPTGLDGAAYRIAQEALTNALKHGGGEASLVIAYEDDAVRISVANPVSGSPAANGTGHGLIGMRERAVLYGGELRAGADGKGGFRVDAWLPT